MRKQFEKITPKEQELILNAPVLFSVLAASYDHEISASEKADAIELAHIKTFSAHPLLLKYYQEVETNFKNNFELTVKKYAPFSHEKREALKKEIGALNLAISKLDKDFAMELYKSLSEYAEHVKKAEKNLLMNFVFPIPISGLTD